MFYSKGFKYKYQKPKMFSFAFSAILIKEVSLVFSLISVINTMKIMWYH